MHDLVVGGGRSPEGPWRPARPDFLVHVTPLSVLFPATFRAHLHKTDPFPLVDARVWRQDWVVHCQPVGKGEEAFRSLAPSIVRVAISTHRLLTLDEGHVTFQYTDSATAQTHSATVTADACIRRFLQHVLPDRCIHVRSCGVLTPRSPQWVHQASEWLGASALPTKATGQPPPVSAPLAPLRCPTCASPLTVVEPLRPTRRPTASAMPTGRSPP